MIENLDIHLIRCHRRGTVRVSASFRVFLTRRSIGQDEMYPYEVLVLFAVMVHAFLSESNPVVYEGKRQAESVSHTGMARSFSITCGSLFKELLAS